MINDNSSSHNSRASIGPSVSIKGEITGEEDILIEGSVEGTINLKKNSVTVASTGKVSAHIFGVVVHVEGEVTGDIDGSEKIIIHKSGKVVGNITAPKISVEEGARVKGSICTEMTAEQSANVSIERQKTSTTSVSETDIDLSGKLGRRPGLFSKGKEEGSTSL